MMLSKQLSSFYFSLLFFMAGFFVPLKIEAEIEPFKAEWKDGRLSVIAEKTPLSKILHQVTLRTVMEFLGIENLQGEVFVNFSNLPLDEGLVKLLPHVNHVIVEEKSSDGELLSIHVLILGLDKISSLVISGKLEGISEAELITLLSDPDSGIRQYAVEHLAERGDEQAFTQLQQSLGDENPEVRQTAIASLGQYGNLAIEPVRNLLIKEKNLEVRMAALQLIGQVGDEEAAAFLQDAIKDQEPRIRIAAAEALGYTGSLAAREALIEATKDREPSVRMAALRTLSFYFKDDLTKVYVEQTLFDENETVQTQAEELLEIFTDFMN